jgi:hypothetical protein
MTEGVSAMTEAVVAGTEEVVAVMEGVMDVWIEVEVEVAGQARNDEWDRRKDGKFKSQFYSEQSITAIFYNPEQSNSKRF